MENIKEVLIICIEERFQKRGLHHSKKEKLVSLAI